MEEFDKVTFSSGLGYTRHGLPTFYKLLSEMAETHDKKSHDYASNDNPYGNYHFAGQVASLFAHSYKDAGFVGRIAEKIYRLANLEGGSKVAKNESIEDTERDICVITALWMADRRDRRTPKLASQNKLMSEAELPKGSSMDRLSQYSGDTTGRTIISTKPPDKNREEIDIMSAYFAVVENQEPREIQQTIDYLTRLRRDKLTVIPPKSAPSSGQRDVSKSE